MAYASDLSGVQALLAAYGLDASSVPDTDDQILTLQGMATADVNLILTEAGLDIGGLDSVIDAGAEKLENLLTARAVVGSGMVQGREGTLRWLEIEIRNTTARLRAAGKSSGSTRNPAANQMRLGVVTTRADRVRPKTLTG